MQPPGVARSISFAGAPSLTEQQATALRRLLLSIACFGRAALHHSDRLGSDEVAHAAARKLGYWIEAHPPDIEGFRAFLPVNTVWRLAPSGAQRRELVAASELLVAAPAGPEDARSHAWDTVRAARLASLPVWFVWPDGATQLVAGGTEAITGAPH